MQERLGASKPEKSWLLLFLLLLLLMNEGVNSARDVNMSHLLDHAQCDCVVFVCFFLLIFRNFINMIASTNMKAKDTLVF